MTTFTSARERRLWLWALAVLLAIWGTLGLARTLAGELRERDLIDGAFWLGLSLVGGAVLLQGLRARPGGMEIGIALGVTGAYLIAFLRMSIPEERTHLIEYSVLALLIHEALLERASHGRRIPAARLAIALAAASGVLDECIQAFLPSRVFDPVDLLFNLLAAVMAVTASVALRWARRRRRSRSG